MAAGVTSSWGWARRSVRKRRTLRFVFLGVVLVPPLLLGTEALVRARLGPVSDLASVTRIYGRPIVLERGLRLDKAFVEDHLRRLGYREASGDEVRIGEFYLGRRGWIIGRRPFRGASFPSEGGQGGQPLLAGYASERPEPDPGDLPGRQVPDWVRDLDSGGFAIIRFDYSGRITRMEDADGRRLTRVLLEPELIGRVSGEAEADRLPVRLDEVPEALVSALLTVEDQRFYQHFGLDFRRIAAAAAANLKVGRVVQGGSTLTQQLAKNLFLSPRRSFDRKLREAALATVLEFRHSKEEILQAYLNEIYLGQDGAVGIHGVGRAAEFFFGKEVGSLTLPESALLVALIRAPSLYSPLRNPETALTRRNLVLGLMRNGEVISQEEFDKATATPIQLKRRSEPIRSARYFIDFATQAADVGNPGGSGQAMVTTLDPRLQQVAEEAVGEGLARLERDFPWLREAESGEPLQAALVALDPRTGEILAMIGGRDYGQSQFNRAVGARRQPGSAFKPVVALAALARPDGEVAEEDWEDDEDWYGRGRREPLPPFTLASVLEDAPLQVETRAGLWQPANYSGEFSGTVTLRDALERSLNVPFARLGMAVGPERIVETAKALGIKSHLNPYPSLALGAGEVSPLEMTAAFGVLAAGGVRHELRAIFDDSPRPSENLGLSLFDEDRWERGGYEWRRGENDWDLRQERVDADPTGVQVFDAAETYLVTSALEGAVERGTGQGIRNLGFHGDVAAKSGTTNDFRDGWFVGYTPNLVVGVWVGFDHGGRLELPGAGVALPIFTRFLKEAVGEEGDDGQWGSRGFSYPSGLERVDVDPETGLRGGWGCRGEPELFLRGSAPRESCGGFRIDRRTFQRIVDEGGEGALRLIRRLLGREGGGDQRR